MAQLLHSDYADYGGTADELLTGEAVALDLRPTSFVLRGAGAAIDFIVYLGAYLLATTLFTVSNLSAAFDPAFGSIVAVVALVLFIVVAPTAVELLSHGRSLGKLAIGARIVRDDGGAIGFRHAFIRALVGVLEIYLTLGGTAVLVAIFNSKAKRLGDMLAGTYSQHERIPHFQPPVYGVPLELVEWSTTADVARMPDPLARRIAHFLAQANGLSPAARIALGHQLANEASPYVFPLPQANAELFLAAVAAVRREREFAALQIERKRLDLLGPTLTGLPHRFSKRISKP
jgi:uncharacterized RDD family membrane protein YckC